MNSIWFWFRHLERYQISDIENDLGKYFRENLHLSNCLLGINRQDLISLAMMLGSDYTVGIRFSDFKWSFDFNTEVLALSMQWKLFKHSPEVKDYWSSSSGKRL